ncbi:MAG: esterase [Mycobacterium sp.]|nr:esterase [Mycobacterium sp.]
MNPQEKCPLTFVFVHGFLDDAAVWRPLIAALHVPDSESRAVDLAGMAGRPREAGPYTLGRYANDVIDVIDVIDGLSGPVVLVGHSMGTLIAELAAAERPDEVVALALVTPIPLAGAHLPEAAVAPFKSVGGSAAALRALRLQASPHFPERELARISEAGAQIAPDAIPGFVDLWNFGVPQGQEPSTFSGSVLVISGGADPVSTYEVIHAGVLPRFESATLKTFGTAGHWVHAEQPEMAAELLTRFVTTAVRRCGEPIIGTHI